MSLEKSPKIPKKNNCEKCDYATSNKKDYQKHLLTRKHINRTNLNTIEQENSPANNFICKKCDRGYRARNSLWYHENKCKKSPLIVEKSPKKNVIQILIHENKELIKENKDFKNIIMELVRSNTEFQKQMIDVCQKQSNTIISNNNNMNHSNNKTFNLHFFLNEQCKDAMNMSEFVNTFELQLSDLESVGDLGYVEGISKIIVDRLNTMDIYKRPMHCSDAKRETLYIKDEDRWEKEERHNPKLRKAIQTVSFKNMKLVNAWSDTYPESKNGESRLNDRYMKLIKQSTGGNGESNDNEDKIIRRIAKEIVIGK